MPTIKTIIADDEPNARKRIWKMLDDYEDFEVIRSCSDGTETLTAIRNLMPDLVFLDIQMPGYDGFELLEQLDVTHLPKIIFITAYDEFALRAFEVHAIDYLMKPFDRRRFEDALEIARESIRLPSHRGADDSISELLETLKAKQEVLKKIMIKERGKIFFVDTSEIKWIESAGNYIKIVCNDSQYMIRNTMKEMGDKLDSKKFFRIHRSTIINIKKVKVIEPWFNGDYHVIMQDGTRFNMSRNYKRLLNSF